MIFAILSALFGCPHRHLTSPRKCSPEQRRRLKTSAYYRCNDCAADLPCSVLDEPQPEPKAVRGWEMVT